MRLISASRVCAVILSVAALYFTASVAVPIVVAVIFAMLLDPFVSRLELRNVSRLSGTVIVLTAFLLLTAATGWLGYRAASRVASQTPQYISKIESLRSIISQKTDGIFPPNVPMTRVSVSESSIQRVEVVEGFSSWRGWFLRLIGSVFEMISLALFVPLLIFYLLLDKSDLVESFNTLTGKIWYLPKTNSEIPRMLRTFFSGNLTGALILVFLHGALFYAIGIPHSWGLALITAPLNLIPIVGAPLAAIFPLAQGLVLWNLDQPLPFLGLFISLIVFHFVVGNVVIPQIVGNRVNVNPAALIIGLLFWGWIWGPIGFLLAIPLTATIKILLESNSKSYSLSNLMADRPRHVIRNQIPGPIKLNPSERTN